MAVIPTNVTDLAVLVIGAYAMLITVMAMWMYGKLQRYKEHAELVRVLTEAKRKPVIIVIDRSGKMIPFIAEQNPKNRGLIEHSKYTLINPDLVSPKARSRFTTGGEILFYPLPGFFPYSIQSAAALVQLGKKIRENDGLNWIQSELQVLSLTFNGTKTLYDDCRSVITAHLKFGDELPEEYRAPEAMELDEIVDEANDYGLSDI